ncbi:conjugal transfer protein [Parvimonas micra]|nr:conjugal transfer protein [Parvimonas micra]
MIRIRSPTKKKVNRMSISDWKRKNSNRFFMYDGHAVSLW